MIVPDGNNRISTHLRLPCSFFCILSKLIIDVCMSLRALGGNMLAYSILLAILRISFANEDEISSEESKLLL